MKKKDLYYERIPTKLLREDVKYLGDTLGKVIATQEGSKFFDLEILDKIKKLFNSNFFLFSLKKLSFECVKELSRRYFGAKACNKLIFRN